MKADGGAVEGRKSLDPGGSRGCMPVSATAGASVDREPVVAEVSRQGLREDARGIKCTVLGARQTPRQTVFRPSSAPLAVRGVRDHGCSRSFFYFGASPLFPARYRAGTDHR